MDRWWNSKHFKSNNFSAFKKLPRVFGFYVYWEKSSLRDTRYILTFNKLHSSQNGGRHIEKSLWKTEWHEFLLRNNQSHGVFYRHSLDSKIWRRSSELPLAPLLFPKAQGKNKAFDNVRPSVPKMNSECLLLVTLRKREKNCCEHTALPAFQNYLQILSAADIGTHLTKSVVWTKFQNFTSIFIKSILFYYP